MSAETIVELPARRFFFGLFPAAGKLGIIEDERNAALGFVLSGERLYFRNVEVFEKGKWQEDTQYYPVHLTSDVGKKYLVNLGFYFSPSDAGDVFSRLQSDWEDCRRG